MDSTELSFDAFDRFFHPLRIGKHIIQSAHTNFIQLSGIFRYYGSKQAQVVFPIPSRQFIPPVQETLFYNQSSIQLDSHIRKNENGYQIYSFFETNWTLPSFLNCCEIGYPSLKICSLIICQDISNNYETSVVKRL